MELYLLKANIVVWTINNLCLYYDLLIDTYKALEHINFYKNLA